MRKPGFNSIQLIAAIPVVLLLMAASCRQSKNAGQTEHEIIPAEGQPEWMISRPVSPGYYIGIGSASKTAQPLDYQGIAKKNALNDLASEISVRVQGTTFLNSLEVNKNFSEEFISTISTTTNELVENYETAGLWENEKEYWIYYRISKSEYARQKKEKKDKAMNAAYDYYLKGREAETLANIPAAFDLYFRGLFELKEYWNDVNEYQADSSRIYLDNTLYQSIQRIGSGLMLKSETDKVVLSSNNSYSASVPFMVVYNGRPVRNITADYRYERNRYMKPRVEVTGENGSFTAIVQEVDLLTKENVLDVRINLEALVPHDLDKAITLPLVKNIMADKRILPIQVQTPSFFIQSQEKSFGAMATSNVLMQAMQSQLVKQGMRLASDSGESDFIVNILSNTTAGGQSQGFAVAFLEMNIEVKNSSSGEIVFKESRNDIKGLQLNTNAAGIEAYKKGQDRIESEIVKSLMDAIF